MKKILSSLALGMLLLPVLVSAEIPTEPPVIPGDQTTLFRVINDIINWIFWGLLIAAIIVIIIAAFRFLTSAGDPDKVKEARNYIIYAIVAIVVAFLAEGIVFFVERVILRAQQQ